MQRRRASPRNSQKALEAVCKASGKGGTAVQGGGFTPRCSQILPVDFPGPSGDSPCLIWGLQITPDPRKHFLTQKVCLQLDDERDAECLGQRALCFAKGFLPLFPEASLFIGSAGITGVHVGPSASKGAWGIMVGKSQTPDAQDRWSIPNPLSRQSTSLYLWALRHHPQHRTHWPRGVGWKGETEQ